MIFLVGYITVPILVLFLCWGRRGSFAYRVGQLVNLVAGLGTLAALYYLISAGNKARWSSEGAGILFIFLLILMLGLLALVLGGLFLRYLFRSDDGSDEDSQARLRTGVAVLVVVAVGGGIAYAAGSSAIGRRSHDDDVVNVFVSGDESEGFSVDNSWTLKRWSARNGLYLGTLEHLVQRHFWNREGEASVERLRHWRLGPAKPRRRRY